MGSENTVGRVAWCGESQYRRLVRKNLVHPRDMLQMQTMPRRKCLLAHLQATIILEPVHRETREITYFPVGPTSGGFYRARIVVEAIFAFRSWPGNVPGAVHSNHAHTRA